MTESRNNTSIRSKIAVAVAAAAVLNSLLGLVVFYVLYSLTSSPLLSAVVTLAVISAALFAGGRVLSASVLRPIAKVGLLAKTLERSRTSDLPDDTGAAETDELVRILARGYRSTDKQAGQPAADHKRAETIQRVKEAGSSDDVVAAVEEPSELQDVLDRIAEAIAAFPDRTIPADNGPSRHNSVGGQLDALLSDAHRLLESARSVVLLADRSAEPMYENIQIALEKTEKRIEALNKAAFEFGRSPSGVTAVRSILANAIGTEADRGRSHDEPDLEESSAAAVTELRDRYKDALKNLQRIGEGSQKLSRAAESADDISRRTKLLALNVSLQGSSRNAPSTVTPAFAVELEAIAARAEALVKDLVSVEEAVPAEITEAENTLGAGIAKMSSISANILKIENSFAEKRASLSSLAALQSDLESVVDAYGDDSERTFRELTDSIAESEEIAARLKLAGDEAADIVDSISALRSAVWQISPDGVERRDGEPDADILFVDPDFQPHDDVSDGWVLDI